MAETYKIQRKKDDGTMEDVILQGASSGSGVSFIAEEDISITSVSKVALKWSVDGVNNVTTPTDGMIIALRVPGHSGSGYGVVLSIDGGTTYYPIVEDAYTKIYTDLVAGSTHILTFNAYQTVSAVKLSESGGTTVTGCWQVSDRDTDQYVRQNYINKDDNYTLLFRGSSGLTLTGGYTGDASYTNSIYANPSTGTIYANDFVVDGKSIVGGGGGSGSGEMVIDLGQLGSKYPTETYTSTIDADKLQQIKDNFDTQAITLVWTIFRANSSTLSVTFRGKLSKETASPRGIEIYTYYTASAKSVTFYKNSYTPYTEADIEHYSFVSINADTGEIRWRHSFSGLTPSPTSQDKMLVTTSTLLGNQGGIFPYEMKWEDKPTTATTSKAGLVKPDGETITVDTDGTIHAVGGGSSSGGNEADTFVVNFTHNSTDNGYMWAADQTFSEVYSKIQQGKVPFVNYGNTIFTMRYVHDTVIEFAYTYVNPINTEDGDPGRVTDCGFRWTSDNTITWQDKYVDGPEVNGGGGQPLYRHDIKLEDNTADLYFIGITVFSTDEAPYDTFEQVRDVIGIGKCVSASGSCGGSQEPIYSLYLDNNELVIWYSAYCDEHLAYDDIDMNVTDSVTPIAQVSGAASAGGGQPLYSHCISVYESANDTFSIYLQIISTISEVVDTEDKLKTILGTATDGGHYCVCTGTGTPSGVSSIRNMNGDYKIYSNEIMGDSTDLFADHYDLMIDDTVTTIGAAGGGGGSCIITDLGDQTDHATAGSTIIELLKPESVPQGNYVYTYYTTCRSDGTLAICFKNENEIQCTQISSSRGTFKYFVYDIVVDDYTVSECFNPMGIRFQEGRNIVFEWKDDYTVINATNPKLYPPAIRLSGSTLTIRNAKKNQDYVGSYDIYDYYTDTLIVNTKNTTIDLSLLNMEDGQHYIVVKAKAITFNNSTIYDDSEYSTSVQYTHDNAPILAGSNWSTSEWYNGCSVDKSVITRITFDNTYEPTSTVTESWDASKNGDGSVMCYRDGSHLTIKPIHTTNIVHVNSCYAMFSGFTNLTTIENLTALQTSNVTSMYGMFQRCYSLRTLDLSNLNTSNVTNMNYMFQDCSSLPSLNLSNFDTSNVTSMYGMFYNCSFLNTLDLSNFDTSNVTDMNSMFYWCTQLLSLDLSNFDTSNVTNMNYMFYNCNKLTLDCSDWDVDKVTSRVLFNGNTSNVIPPEWF